MFTYSDIAFVFSGGTGNYDPFSSIGGDPSNIEIADVSANLFSSLDDNQLRSGIIDYRCFYVFNQNPTDTLYDFSIYVENKNTNTCLLGVRKQNDIQKITLSGVPTSGNLVMSYDGINMTINFTTNMTQLANNFVQALTNVGVLGTSAVATANTGYYVVEITFENESGYKYHPLLQVVTNNLSPSTVIFVEKIQEGSPINIVTPKTSNILTKPDDIIFYNYDAVNMLELTSLRPYEGFPVWLQRIILPGAAKSEEQKFTFMIKGKILS